MQLEDADGGLTVAEDFPYFISYNMIQKRKIPLLLNIRLL